MAESGFRKIKQQVTEHLQAMTEKADLSSAYLRKFVYPKYLDTQKKRWAVDNASEEFFGGLWPDLKNDKDKKYKAKKFAKFPGSGQKLMVRTGALYKAISDSSDGNHEALFTDSSMVISTTLNYALYLDNGTPKMAARPISQFSDSWKESILDDFQDWMMDRS